MPRPVYHDELSYLLAADTFAHGRLANPTHPLWQHFESFYVLHQPTYASKYPPGQGLLLALGQLLGRPIVGVWLGVAAMCTAITWMLSGFMPRRWALFGGLLVLAHLGLLSYWSQSYWGGALAATGGALVFGALPRIVRRPAGAIGLAAPALASGLAAGLLILAITRPFEGALVSMGAAVPLLFWLGRGQGRGRRWLSVAVPLLALLGIGFAGIAGYNRAVTGDAFRMPFSLYDDLYHVRPLFVLQSMRPIPEYRHDILRRYFVGVEVREIEDQRSFTGWARLRLRRLERSRVILLGPVLTASLLVLPWVWRARGVGLAVVGGGLLLAAVAVTHHHYPHYAAPAFALVVLMAVQGWRWLILRLCRLGVRRTLAMTVVVGVTLIARLVLPDPILAVGLSRSANRAKASIERRLEELGGKHLVFVHHGRFADVHDEWVWNGADIDSRQIVFARAMTPAQDAELAAYYRDRRAWRVEIGAERPGIIDFVPNIEPSGP